MLAWRLSNTMDRAFVVAALEDGPPEIVNTDQGSHGPLQNNGFVNHIHGKKPKGGTMPEVMRRANNAKSRIRAEGSGWICSSEPSASHGRRSRSRDGRARGPTSILGQIAQTEAAEHDQNTFIACDKAVDRSVQLPTSSGLLRRLGRRGFSSLRGPAAQPGHPRLCRMLYPGFYEKAYGPR